MTRDLLASVNPASVDDRAASVLAAARARHDAMSPARRALADVGADVHRLVVASPRHDTADRVLAQVGLTRAMWRYAGRPEALLGHAPGTPVLVLAEPDDVWPDDLLDAVRTALDTRGFVPVAVDDVAGVLGET